MTEPLSSQEHGLFDNLSQLAGLGSVIVYSIHNHRRGFCFPAGAGIPGCFLSGALKGIPGFPHRGWWWVPCWGQLYF